jgi:hypothetical protein
VEGFCEHGNERSGSIKCWEVLEQMHNSQLEVSLLTIVLISLEKMLQIRHIQ